MSKQIEIGISVDTLVKSGMTKHEAIGRVSDREDLSYLTTERYYRAYRNGSVTKSRKKKEKIIGIIGDSHIPYEHPEYLDFCASTFKSQGVTDVIHIGDLLDHHAMSFHDSEPSLKGAYGERIDAMEKLEPWFEAFPKLTYIKGNHCKIPARKLTKIGIDPEVYMRPLAHVYNFPKDWKTVDHTVIDNVLYHHGETANGVNGFRNDAKNRMMNTVSGHNHSNFGVSYTATEHRLVYGMSVGCGVDVGSMAFAYGKYFKLKPVLGCGVVKENGKLPLCFPMDLGEKW